MKKLLTRLALLMILCAALALPVFADAVTDSISVCIGYFGWSEDEYVEKAKFSWQELCDTIDDRFDIAAESRRLKENPEKFETIRNEYRYREEYF